MYAYAYAYVYVYVYVPCMFTWMCMCMCVYIYIYITHNVHLKNPMHILYCLPVPAKHFCYQDSKGPPVRLLSMSFERDYFRREIVRCKAAPVVKIYLRTLMSWLRMGLYKYVACDDNCSIIAFLLIQKAGAWVALKTWIIASQLHTLSNVLIRTHSKHCI